MNSKERSLAVIQGGPVDRPPPVFPLLMFFAQQRLGVTYREFATNGKVLAEAQFNIRRKFTVDAVTACSDAFRIAADLGADMFNVDHLVDFETACAVYGQRSLYFKGNINPVAGMLQATPEECGRRCHELLRMAAGLRYMLSPGCEVPGETPDDVFRAFCEAPQTI